MASNHKEKKTHKAKRSTNIGLKRYFAFIKEVKSRNVTHKKSIEIYHLAKEKLGKIPTRNDFEFIDKLIEKGRGVLSEQEKIQRFIDALEETSEKGKLQTTFKRHYGESGFNFDLENEILKVSISTKKTRGKKFSVRG